MLRCRVDIHSMAWPLFISCCERAHCFFTETIMSLLVRAFPLRESVADFEVFVSTLQGPRQADIAAFYEAYGIAHESWHLQQTENGPWVIVVTLLRDPAQTAARYASSSDEFASWFKG